MKTDKRFESVNTHSNCDLVGNGKSLFLINNADIVSARADLDSPRLFSLTVSGEKDGYFECHSERYPASFARCASLYRTHFPLDIKNGSADVTVTDLFLPNLQVFVRETEARVPIRFSLSHPPYVCCSLVKNYKLKKNSFDAFLLDTPRGVHICDGVFSERSENSIIALSKNISTTENGEILFPVGKSYFVFADITDLGLEKVEKALELCENEDFKDMAISLDKKNKLEIFSALDNLKNSIDCNAERACGLENSLAALFSLRTASGLFISSFEAPLVRPKDTYEITSALLSLGFEKEAKEFLDFFIASYKRDKKLFSSYTAKGKAASQSEISVYSATKLMSAVAELVRVTDNSDFLAESRRLISYLLQRAKEKLLVGMLPLSLDEDTEIQAEHLILHINDASLYSTLLFKKTLIALIELSERHPKALSLDKGSLEKLLLEINQGLKSGFSEDSGKANGSCKNNCKTNENLSVNSPKRGLLARKSRFSHLPCISCLDKLGFSRANITEKNKNGIYLCHKCLSVDSGFSFSHSPLELFGEVSALATAALLDPSFEIFKKEDILRRLTELSERDAEYLSDTLAPRTLIALLTAAKRHGIAEGEFYSALENKSHGSFLFGEECDNTAASPTASLSSAFLSFFQ